jgi:sigma-B regulation protein RsbU (phosphoserine phosphatase)
MWPAQCAAQHGETLEMGSSAAVERPFSQDHWESEKEEARLIQQSLLPTGSLQGSSFEISYNFSPYAEVGGDFADFFNLPDGRVGVYVGDVAGKGLSAAMYAALVMGALRGIHKSGVDAAAVLELLNRRLMVRPVTGRYCATLYATFDPVTLLLTVANAGLPYPLVASKSGCSKLSLGGMPTAMFPGTTYDQHSVHLLPGDSVLFATDGLHELQNSDADFLNAAELEDLWQACGKGCADSSLVTLFERVRAFSNGTGQHDDITAVVLKVL